MAEDERDREPAIAPAVSSETPVLASPVLATQATLPQIVKAAKAKKKKAKRAPAKFKPTSSDALLLRAVQSGQTIGQFAATNNLDLETLDKRVKKLVTQKFVVRNDADPQYLHLGLGGLEYLTKINEKKHAHARSKTESESVPTLSAPTPKTESAKPVEITPAVQRHVTEYEEEERDLIELMQEERKKAESAGLLKNKRSPIADSKALADLPLGARKTLRPELSTQTPTKTALPTHATTSDVCEVCKSTFKTSVREPQLAKFANCVCGAPFHQDCYDGTIDTGDGKCPRCGRILKPVLGKSANDALSDIKDAFE